ncbi:hypothetical protein G7054_g1359 [Neopestalotiopsis clavispora]|nr:hypothetical protein G7054_g1359 [Neopestalotiopsis clavispora]
MKAGPLRMSGPRVLACKRLAITTRCFHLRPQIATGQRTTNLRKHGNNKVAEDTDVLIVGSGAGALTAALRARTHGLRVTIIEKCATLGGASVISGGGLWIPDNPVARAAGIKDSKEAALKYFELAVGDVGPASSLAKRGAYLQNGPDMIHFLQDLKFQFHLSKGYPDYYPKLDGAMGATGGRTIESMVFDTRKLGPWERYLPPNTLPVAIYTDIASTITRMTSSLGAMIQSIHAVLPVLFRTLAGQRLTSLGRALVAQLLHLNLQNGTNIHLNTKLVGLVQDDKGGIIGVNIESPMGNNTIRAKSGVILAAGGFARNSHMRQQYMPGPASTDWTLAPAGDTGDAVSLGIESGAATSLLDDAWWGPTISDPVSGSNHFALSERSRPFCIMVDSNGQRFTNEAASYVDAGHDQYERHRTVRAIPAWLIMDASHRKRYMLGGLFARVNPKAAIAAGRMIKADTVQDLARQANIDQDGLVRTIQRYNKMCEDGIDIDFGKGDNAYDNFFGDPAVKPNPNMGPLTKAPFYATRIWPGDLGTKGGLLTDEFQRVVREDGSVIERLYACGNCAASIMGRTYLGAGSTLGPAMTHGFIAANHISAP